MSGKQLMLLVVVLDLVLSLGSLSVPSFATGPSVTVAQGAEPATLDAFQEISRSGYNVTLHIYDPLFMRSDDGKIVPMLATGYNIVDPTTWRITLRQGDIAPDPRPLRQARAAILNYRFDRFTLAAGAIGRASGAQIVTSGDLNTSSMPEQFVAIADVLIANQFELERLAEKLGGRGIGGLLNLGPSAIVATSSARGAVVLTPGGEEFVSPARARQVVDPIGAGDAFAGSTAAAYGRGIPLPFAARIGAVTASFVVEARGCQTNLPNWDRMAERYRETFREDPPATTSLAAENSA